MKNFVQEGRRLELNVGTGKTAGDPVAVGAIVGVCVTDADANGVAVVDTAGVYLLSVTGNDGTSNVAINVGDPIYIQTNGTLNVDNTGELFGYALDPVASGATSTIRVKVAAK